MLPSSNPHKDRPTLDSIMYNKHRLISIVDFNPLTLHLAHESKIARGSRWCIRIYEVEWNKSCGQRGGEILCMEKSERSTTKHPLCYKAPSLNTLRSDPSDWQKSVSWMYARTDVNVWYLCMMERIMEKKRTRHGMKRYPRVLAGVRAGLGVCGTGPTGGVNVLPYRQIR